MFVVFILIGISLIISGILIREFKLYDLITFYRSMTEEEKKSYDIAKVANNLGLCCYCLGVIAMVITILLDFINFTEKTQGIIMTAYVFFMIISIEVVTIIENKNRLNKMRTMLITMNLILFLVIAFVFFALYKYN
ncbi:hypothetical protein CSA08_04800 [Candidatus Gracilibacteria bacterium]|nr:MAG: hypothetical protein CSA08_04800 [Candidatus Gracilibacteria bacterium]